MEIKELDRSLIERANHNSFNGNRGDISEQSYKSYVETVLEWDISDLKKQKILNQVYNKYSVILKYEAQHVSVMVAGPARYNAKKFDKGDQVLKASHDFCVWFEDLEKQIEQSKRENQEDNAKDIIKSIKRDIELGFNPTGEIMCLATVDNKKFIEVYEKLYPKYKWRKNSNIYKIYQASLNGEVKEIKKEIFYEDENLTAYIEGDRAYIRFPMKIQRQLIVALKSRKWWWNSHKGAWSTYLNRVDKEWVSTISERYAAYL